MGLAANDMKKECQKMLRAKLNRVAVYLFICVMILGAMGVSAWVANAHASVPLIYMDGVVRNETVQISGSHFPANQNFTVRMGPYGGYGINGAVSSTVVNSGNGTFTANVAIPAAMRDYTRIAIRLESGIYSSYNWFWNNSTGNVQSSSGLQPREGETAGSGQVSITSAYVGPPLMEVTAINGEVVTVNTSNFPPNTVFNFTMGSRGDEGFGPSVGQINTGDGSPKSYNLTIPPSIAHYGYIWIRAQSNVHYGFVGFYNPAPVPTLVTQVNPGKPPINAVRVSPNPTMTVCAVQAGSTVTVVTNNLATNVDYTVRANYYGSYGYNGYILGTISPGSATSVRATFNIPAQLANHWQIAIRADAPGGYNAYNWFWNNTATVC